MSSTQIGLNHDNRLSERYKKRTERIDVLFSHDHDVSPVRNGQRLPRLPGVR